MPEVGRKAPEETHTQSVCFYKDADWTEASSKKWCEEHDYYTDGLDETDSLYRWRQYDPDDSKFRYRNQEIEKDSIFLVIGYLKDSQEDRKEPPMSTDQHRSKDKEPMRCFEGNAKPHEPFWKFKDELNEDDEPEMELYGYISEYSWWEDDITPKMFKADLMKYGKGGPITIRMNSYGGDVIAASVMSTILRDYPGRVTVQIDGVAASAATVVAVAGDRVRMQDTAYFMIHDPLVIFFFAALNIEDLTRLADSLEAVKEGIINTYETKTELSRMRLSKLMTDETWMDAQRAVDLGFADEVIHAATKAIPIPIPMDQAAVVNCLRNYRNAPPEVMQALTQNIPEAAESSEPLTDNQKREAEALRNRVQKLLRKDN